jgi:hypothetical protein
MELIIELPEAELDEVYGGISFNGATFSVRQNARGGDAFTVGGDGGDGGDARGALGVGGVGGAGGAAGAAIGGVGGSNSAFIDAFEEAPA